MVFVLRHTLCIGIVTNQWFLHRILRHPAFHAVDYTTGLISENLEDLCKVSSSTSYTIRHELPGIVSAYLRHQRSLDSSRRSFGSIPLRWRNVPTDRTSASHIDYINFSTSLLGGGENGVFVKYINNRQDAPRSYLLHVWDEEKAQTPTRKEQDQFINKSGGILTKRYYQAISQRDLEESAALKVHIMDFKPGHMRVALNGRQQIYHLFANGDTVYVQSPELGVSIKYLRKSLLTFAGMLDTRMPGQNILAGEPCASVYLANANKRARYICDLYYAYALQNPSDYGQRRGLGYKRQWALGDREYEDRSKNCCSSEWRR